MNTPADKRPIVLHLVSAPCVVPVANRLRSVLKRLLRQYGFRCIRIDGDGLDGAKTIAGPSDGEEAS
jgi:hypothetical protein